jgi:hypothetical protein
MTPTSKLATGTVALALLLAGCSGNSVDSRCDVTGITADVEHILEESSMSITSLDTLRCSGDWAVAQLMVGDNSAKPEQTTLVFQNSDAGWILKAPEVACTRSSQFASIPDDLADLACAPH